MAKGIGRIGDITKSHDGCIPVPWIATLAINVLANSRPVLVKMATAIVHGIPPQFVPHPPILRECSSSVLARGKGIGRKGDGCFPPCRDSINLVSNNVLSK